MKWRVLIRPRAEADLREARQWYEEQRRGLGDELVAAVRQAVRSLEEAPERRLFYFREFSDRVVVFRILHAKQDHPRRLPE